MSNVVSTGNVQLFSFYDQKGFLFVLRFLLNQVWTFISLMHSSDDYDDGNDMHDD